MFGAEPKVGISTSSLPSKLLKDIEDEDDLRRLIDGKNIDGQKNKDIDAYEDTDEGKDKNEDEDRNGDDDIQNILEARSKAAQSLKKQAKKMKATSHKSHPPAKVGDTLSYLLLM